MDLAKNLGCTYTCNYSSTSCVHQPEQIAALSSLCRHDSYLCTAIYECRNLVLVHLHIAVMMDLFVLQLTSYGLHVLSSFVVQG